MSDTQWTWTKEGSIASDMCEAHNLIGEVMERVRTDRWNSKDLFAVELALEEVFINAVTHGNNEDKTKSVRYACRLNPNRVQFYVEDEGEGFDVSGVADPTQAENIDVSSGRGVFLVKGFATRTEWNERGNAVVVEIDRSAEQ